MTGTRLRGVIDLGLCCPLPQDWAWVRDIEAAIPELGWAGAWDSSFHDMLPDLQYDGQPWLLWRLELFAIRHQESETSTRRKGWACVVPRTGQVAYSQQVEAAVAWDYLHPPMRDRIARHIADDLVAAVAELVGDDYGRWEGSTERFVLILPPADDEAA